MSRKLFRIIIFQDSVFKDLPVDADDDVKAKYCLNFDDTNPFGKVEKIFCIYNNSNLPFEFQWKIRDANISSNPEKYKKLSKYQVKIDPESGTIEPTKVREFLVSVNFENADIGEYRLILRYFYIII